VAKSVAKSARRCPSKFAAPQYRFLVIAVTWRSEVLGYVDPYPVSQTPKVNMTVSQTPSSVAASDRPLSAADRKRRRHKVARRLYEALVAQDPNRAITLCDEAGNVLARHDPLPEHDAPKIASLTHVPTANGHDC
jgi:hypothetical protein